jgi:hypothetical protein
MACTSQFLDILAAVAMVVAAPGAEERTDEERMEALLLVHVKCVRADPLDADPFAKWWEMKLDSQADGPWYEQRCRGGGSGEYRNVGVWRTENMVLGRGTNPKRSRRACTCEYGLQSSKKDFGWVISSRGLFATPVDFPPQDCSPYRGLHARRERLGFVHR